MTGNRKKMALFYCVEQIDPIRHRDYCFSYFHYHVADYKRTSSYKIMITFTEVGNTSQRQ